MKKRIARLTAVAGIAAVVTLGAGCASTEDMATLRAEIDSMKGQASGAAAAAAAAQAEASEAARTANRALSAAREAQTCCAANSEKIERMFKKSMMK